MPVIDSVNRKGIGGKRVTKGPVSLVGPRSGDIKSDFTRLSGIRGKVDQYEVTDGAGTLEGAYTFTIRPYRERGFAAARRAVGDVAILQQKNGIADPSADIACVARKTATGSTSAVTLGPVNALAGDRLWVVVENRDASTLRYKLDAEVTIDNPPSLDLRFAESKSTIDSVSGSNLVTFTRGTGGTYVGSDGLLKTAGVNERRFDHDPVTGKSLGLLVEELRTNYLQWSEDITQWTNSNGGAPVLELNAGTDPTGANNAILVRNAGSEAFLGHSLTYTRYTRYTFSAYFKAGSGSRATILLHSSGASSGYWDNRTVDVAVTFDLTSGAVVPHEGAAEPIYATIAPAGNGWYRCSLTALCTADSTATHQFIRNTSQPYESVYVFGFQVEAGSLPTSYIKNDGNPLGVTRAADVAIVDGANFTSWYNSSEGSLAASFTPPRSPAIDNEVNTRPSNALWQISDGSTGGENYIQEVLSNFAIGRYYLLGWLYSGGIRRGLHGGDSFQSDFNAACSAFKQDDFALAVSGIPSVSFDRDVTVIMPATTQTQLLIGSRVADGWSMTAFNGAIARLQYWPTHLPETPLKVVVS